jgi:hypothetical protein
MDLRALSFSWSLAAGHHPQGTHELGEGSHPEVPELGAVQEELGLPPQLATNSSPQLRQHHNYATFASDLGNNAATTPATNRPQHKRLA